MSNDPRKPDDVLPPRSNPDDGPQGPALPGRSGANGGDERVESPFSDLPPQVERLVLDLRDGVEEALAIARARGEELLRKGRFTRVRVSFRGRELVSMPLAAFVAVEALSVLRLSLPAVLLLNLVGKLSLSVDFINEAAEEVAAGRAHLLDGDLDEAIACFRQAVQMDPKYADAHLRLGIALRMKGDADPAATAFERASQLDPDGEVGVEAKKQLEKLSRG